MAVYSKGKKANISGLEKHLNNNIVVTIFFQIPGVPEKIDAEME